MGNRAVVTMSQTDDAPCIYLHWNGGRASVEGFLKSAKMMNLQTADQAKFFDEFAQIIAKYFFGCEVGMHIYREEYGRADTDNWDNGVFVIDSALRIVGRDFVPDHMTEERNDIKSHGIYLEMMENRTKAIEITIEATLLSTISMKAELNKNLNQRINMRAR